MSLINSFENFIDKESLFTKSDGLLIAVSGGVDSVVLCELCHRTGYRFEIAHCNFQLRDQESERDQAFVEALAKHYQVNIHLRRFDTNKIAAEQKESIQVTARNLRYNFFKELLQDKTLYLTKLLTAHHLDDSVETSLMNYIKGTGIAGLRGILPSQNNIVRPLLFARKKAILDFANGEGLKWVEDSSNESDKYTRNQVRHELVPAIEKVNANAIANIGDSLIYLKETAIIFQQAIATHRKKLLFTEDSNWKIPVLKLAKTTPIATITFELLKEFNFTSGQLNDVLNLLNSQTGHFVQSATHQIIRNRKWLLIVPLKATDRRFLVLEEPGVIELPGAKFSASLKESSPEIISTSASVAHIDARDVQFPLIIRRPKAGDYFYPLGMRKKKKVARFFIDQKMSKKQKEDAWVLEQDKKIVWIAGHRIDDRFKVLPSTKKILELTLTQT